MSKPNDPESLDDVFRDFGDAVNVFCLKVANESGLSTFLTDIASEDLNHLDSASVFLYEWRKMHNCQRHVNLTCDRVRQLEQEVAEQKLLADHFRMQTKFHRDRAQKLEEQMAVTAHKRCQDPIITNTESTPTTS